MDSVPVLVVGGGPVGMTIALDLAERGIRSILIERNFTTTSHPKMDVTNGRSMELFRRVGLVDALRAVAVPEDHPFDVSWVTSLAGSELYRFRYPSVAQQRAKIRATNDGTQSREPAMRVSQVEIEPVLQNAIDKHPNVDARFGAEFMSLEETDDGIVSTVYDRHSERTYQIASMYLLGCDGGGSRVRDCVSIPLSGQSRVMPRFMTHFHSDERRLLQRWGVAWHYQSNYGTLIAQNDKDIWTLHSRFPSGHAQAVDPSALLTYFAGEAFEHKILVANPWTPHLLVADEYFRGRVLLAGDAAHQYIPTGGYGMNTGIGDAFDMSWKLAAVLTGFGGPGLIGSYEMERRPVGLRNRAASSRHNDVRVAIASLYPDQWAARELAEVAETIRGFGNAENESRGIEFGYVYSGSPIVAAEGSVDIDESFLSYRPTTTPGARLPSTFFSDGTALYDLLGPWFTLLSFDDADPTPFVDAARGLKLPLKVIRIDSSTLPPIYEADLVLVRPDQHVAWRGNKIEDVIEARQLVRKFWGW
jgi:2-polyprenyl-6-methoxyphenol hydroxylase-like FAD-dependent oxidoreductase